MVNRLVILLASLIASLLVNLLVDLIRLWPIVALFRFFFTFTVSQRYEIYSVFIFYFLEHFITIQVANFIEDNLTLRDAAISAAAAIESNAATDNSDGDIPRPFIPPPIVGPPIPPLGMSSGLADEKSRNRYTVSHERRTLNFFQLRFRYRNSRSLFGPDFFICPDQLSLTGQWTV